MEVMCAKTEPHPRQVTACHAPVHASHHVTTSATEMAESTSCAHDICPVRVRVRVMVGVRRNAECHNLQGRRSGNLRYFRRAKK